MKKPASKRITVDWTGNSSGAYVCVCVRRVLGVYFHGSTKKHYHKRHYHMLVFIHLILVLVQEIQPDIGAFMQMRQHKGVGILVQIGCFDAAMKINFFGLFMNETPLNQENHSERHY